MEWTNKKNNDSKLSKYYPSDDVKIYSSRMVVDDKSIDILVFTCQRLTQHKIVAFKKFVHSKPGQESYCDPGDIIFDKEFDSNRDFWYRGTHPSRIEEIIKNGIESDDEIFVVKHGNRKCFKYGNRGLDFEKVGKLITIYKAGAFAQDSSGNASNWFRVDPINKSSISPIRIIGIFTSRKQADDFMQKVTTLS